MLKAAELDHHASGSQFFENPGPRSQPLFSSTAGAVEQAILLNSNPNWKPRATGLLEARLLIYITV